MKRALIAETRKNVMSRLFNVLCAHAEEVDPPVVAPTVNLEDIISRTRKEEKDKLYGRIKELEGENKSFITRTNGYLTKIESLEKALESAQTDDVATLNAKVKELTDLLSTANTELATAREELEALKSKTPVNEDELKTSIRAELDEEYKVKLYIEKKKAESKDNIMGIFLEDIKGNTIEEVDASVESLKQKTLTAKKEMGLVDEEGNPIAPTTKKTKTPPPANPPANDKIKGFDSEVLKAMDVNSEEYKEFRRKALNKR